MGLTLWGFLLLVGIPAGWAAFATAMWATEAGLRERTQMALQVEKENCGKMIKRLREVRDELAEVKGHLSPTDRLLKDVMEVEL